MLTLLLILVTLAGTGGTNCSVALRLVIYPWSKDLWIWACIAFPYAGVGGVLELSPVQTLRLCFPIVLLSLAVGLRC